MAVSTDGWVLHARGGDRTHERMLLSVPSPSAPDGYRTFTMVDTGDPADYPALASDIVAMTLDHREIVSASILYDKFYEVPLQYQVPLEGVQLVTRVPADFLPGRKMPGQGMQLLWRVMSVSSDDLTLVAGGPGWTTYLTSRAQKSDDWSAAALLVDGGLSGGMSYDYNAKLTPDCRYLIVTCTDMDNVARICALPRL